MQLQSLGYAGVSTTDVDAWKTFARDVLDMQVQETASGLALRIDDRVHRILVHPGETANPAYLGWDVGNAADLTATGQALTKAGAGTFEADKIRSSAALTVSAGTIKITSSGGNESGLGTKNSHVSSLSMTSGTQIDEWTYSGGTVQQWSLIPAGNGKFQLANQNSGLVLGTANSSSAGASVDQETAVSANTQLWTFQAVSGWPQMGHAYRLVNAATGMCLDSPTSSTQSTRRCVF